MTPGKDLDNQVMHPGLVRTTGFPRPDQKYRRKREQFPEDEQAQQIAGEDRPETAAGIHQGGDLLQRIAHVQRINNAEKRGDMKYVTEHQAQLVDAVGRELIIEQSQLQMNTFGDHP